MLNFLQRQRKKLGRVPYCVPYTIQLSLSSGTGDERERRWYTSKIGIPKPLSKDLQLTAVALAALCANGNRVVHTYGG